MRPNAWSKISRVASIVMLAPVAVGCGSKEAPAQEAKAPTSTTAVSASAGPGAAQSTTLESASEGADPDWAALNRIQTETRTRAPKGRFFRITTGLRSDLVSFDIVVDSRWQAFDLAAEGLVQKKDDPVKTPLVTFSHADLGRMKNVIGRVRTDAQNFADYNGLRVDKRTFYRSRFERVPGAQFEYDGPVIEFWLGNEALLRSSGTVPNQYRVYDAVTGALLWQAGPEDTDIVFPFLED